MARSVFWFIGALTLAREKKIFEWLVGEHELKSVAKSHRVTLSNRLARVLRCMIAGFLAFMIVLNTGAFGTEYPSSPPNVYTQHEEIITQPERSGEWLGYSELPNHTKSQHYQDLYNWTNMKIPPGTWLDKILIEFTKGWSTMRTEDGRRFSPGELRWQIVGDINRWVNDSIRYKRTPWRTPLDVFTQLLTLKDKHVMYGDCKEYALVKIVILRSLGFKPEDLNILVGYIPLRHNPGEAPGMYDHAIVGVRVGTDDNPNYWVFLDINPPKLKGEDMLRNPSNTEAFFFPLVRMTNKGAFNLFHEKGKYDWDIKPEDVTQQRYLNLVE